MYSADPTGVRSSGVLVPSESHFIALAKSKSQIFMGTTSSARSHRIFSGFKSRCAIPKEKDKPKYNYNLLDATC